MTKRQKKQVLLLAAEAALDGHAYATLESHDMPFAAKVLRDQYGLFGDGVTDFEVRSLWYCLMSQQIDMAFDLDLI